VLAWIQAGEVVAITMRREEIARLVPRRRKKAQRRPLPDLARRLERVFGSKIISDQAMRTIMEQNKGVI
jgi:antitoxin (DNA-binding transcriptional repressor) of toxin-antitoxin stability system